MYIMGFL